MSVNIKPGIKTIATMLIMLIMSIVINGCDNNKNNSGSFVIKQKAQKYSKDTILKGKVSNKKVSITSGKIKVTSEKGKLLVSHKLINDNHYSLKIPAGTKLPIIITFYPDKNNKDQSKLVAVVIYPTISKYDINELTTAIAKNAKALGGYTHANMVMAAENTVNVPDANKTSTGFRGDPTKQYGGWH